MNRLLLVAAGLLLPATVFAQEPVVTVRESSAPRVHVRVLADPADIASFYRSGESTTVRWTARKRVAPYALASYYRSHSDGALGYASTRSRSYDRVIVVTPPQR